MPLHPLWSEPFALPGLVILEPLMNHVQGLFFLQGPGGGDQFLGMGVAREALDDHGGWQAFDKPAERVHVGALGQALVTPVLIEGFQRRFAHHVEQVKLHPVDARVGDEVGGCQHIRDGFVGQPQDHMGADIYPPPAGGLDGPLETGDVVASVERQQRAVVGALQAVFDPDQPVAGIGFQKIQDLFVHAVRSRADGQPDHTGNGQGLVIEPLEMVHRSIRIGIALEIGQEFVGFKPAGDARPAALDLLGDGQTVSKGTGARAPGVTVDASPGGDGAVAVGAAQARIDGDFVNPAAEQPPKVTVQVPVGSFLHRKPLLDHDIRPIIYKLQNIDCKKRQVLGKSARGRPPEIDAIRHLAFGFCLLSFCPIMYDPALCTGTGDAVRLSSHTKRYGSVPKTI